MKLGRLVALMLLLPPFVLAASDQTYQQVIKGGLKDPYSAKFTNVRTYKNGNVCGLVNAKNSFGAYAGPRPFVYLNDGARVEFSTNSWADSCLWAESPKDYAEVLAERLRIKLADDSDVQPTIAGERARLKRLAAVREKMDAQRMLECTEAKETLLKRLDDLYQRLDTPVPEKVIARMVVRTDKWSGSVADECPVAFGETLLQEANAKRARRFERVCLEQQVYKAVYIAIDHRHKARIIDICGAEYVDKLDLVIAEPRIKAAIQAAKQNEDLTKCLRLLDYSMVFDVASLEYWLKEYHAQCSVNWDAELRSIKLN